MELLFINTRVRASLWSGKALSCVLVLAGLLPNLSCSKASMLASAGERGETVGFNGLSRIAFLVCTLIFLFAGLLQI